MVIFRKNFYVASVVLISTFWSVQASGISIVDVENTLESNALEITANVDLQLSEEVEAALRASFPISISTEIKIYRVRKYLFDERIGHFQVFEQIYYDTLSRKFIVTSENPDVAGNYTSLESALRSLGGIRKYSFAIPSLKESASNRIRGKVRVALDRSALPSVLRVAAYIKESWYLQSGWFEFEIQ